jgi:DNA-directed RNA polymerase subunit N (RpoN/RPB10)
VVGILVEITLSVYSRIYEPQPVPKLDLSDLRVDDVVADLEVLRECCRRGILG